MTARSAIISLALLRCAPAQAAEHPFVQLDLDACLAGSSVEIRRLVRVELGDLLADELDVLGDRTNASVGCDGPLAILRVDDPSTGRSIVRTIDLDSAMPAARPRLIALALVELISASWTELAPVTPLGAGPIEPALAPPGAVRGRAERVESFAYRAMLTGGATRFSAAPRMLGGAGLRFADGSSSRLGWMVDVQAHHRSAAMAAYEISTDVYSIGAAAGLHVGSDRARLDFDAGLRGGEVQMSAGANPDFGIRGTSFWSKWLGVLVLGNLAVSITDRIAIDTTLETGYVLSPVSGLANGRREAAVDGAWLQVHLGIAVLL